MGRRPEGGRAPNRLVQETSPYLLQHAYNPVDWYPWGEEALARARAEDRPILLSIGYAACHWCHVMEHESFEDPDVAGLMNENFVCVKVDREERPDIDAIYMDAVQAMTGHGGWPMTMFLAPDGTPFSGGTYFPPEDAHGLPAFRRVLEGVSESWRTRREEVVGQGRRLVENIQRQTAPAPSREPLAAALIAQGVDRVGQGFDAARGGFGGAPKFPQAPVLELMLRAAGPAPAGEMIELTLRHMALGGIYDQAGGGFHRYSVDAAWLVPHFEKMLYDNAQMARVYTHAWQAWKAPLYRRIAIDTLEYLLRDVRDPGGAFYSSEDADSEGEEGKFYVWAHDVFMSVAPEAAGYYGVTPAGNFEGANILTAAEGDPPPASRAKLMEARARRVRPLRDEKILTSWNGMAVSALAEAGAVFGRSDLIDAARLAASFLLDRARGEGGRLLHSYTGGRASVLGMLEDYAFLADGLFTLWEVTFEPRWMEECRRLVAEMLDLFWDEQDGGLFSTGTDHERLILRQKEMVESATPSPNGVASILLQKLGVLTGDADYSRRGVEILRLAHSYMARVPQAAATFLSALDFYLGAPKEIVIVGEGADPRTRELQEVLWGRFLPNKIVAGSPPGIPSPMLEGKEAADGAPTAFVCERYVCKVPTTDPEEFARQLGR